VVVPRNLLAKQTIQVLWSAVSCVCNEFSVENCAEGSSAVFCFHSDSAAVLCWRADSMKHSPS
jgi:hypothetical protein